MGGGADVLLLNQEQMKFLRDYTFDHRAEEEQDDDGEEKEGVDADDDSEARPIPFSPPPYLKLIDSVIYPISIMPIPAAHQFS